MVKREKIAIRWEGRLRRKAVEALVFRGQLAVHRRIEEFAPSAQFSSELWNITHVPTGNRMSGWLQSKADAIKRVKRAFALHHDWSRTTFDTIKRWPKDKVRKVKRALLVP